MYLKSFGVLAVAIAGFYGSISVSHAAEQGVYVVKQAKATHTVKLGGTVVPYKEVTFSAQIPGRVKELAGIEGDAFQEGSLLVAMDDSALLAKRNALLARYRSAEAQLRNAGVQYSRELWSPKTKNAMGGMGMPNLFDQMFTRPMEDMMGQRDQDTERSADLYASGTQVSQARNSMMQVHSEIQAVDAKLRDTRSIAPFSGVILKKFVEVGDTVQPGQPLITYADIEYLQVEVDVPARLRSSLSDAMMLKAELDASGKTVPVRVAQIFPMADAQRHTVKVKFDLPQGISTPGEYIRVLVPDTSSSASLPVVPQSALIYNGSLPALYVRDDTGKNTLRMVRIGRDAGNGMISILSGVRAGDQVITQPNIGTGK